MSQSPKLKFTTKSYKIEGSFTDYLKPTDQVFVSSSGVYINRGVLFSCPLSEVTSLLETMEGVNHFDVDPFVVFGLEFENEHNTQRITGFPEQIIHITSSNTISHFMISDQMINREIEELKLEIKSEPPHHIEISSPSTKEQFIDNVQLALKYIEVNEIEKVVLARKLSVIADQPIDRRLVLAELLNAQPQSYVFAIDSFVGASPELLIEKKSRTLISRPMAGTRKRYARINDDDASIANLQNDHKDLLEHQVVVSDIVNKLKEVSSDVTYNSSPFVARLPNVVHLTSEVSAKCDPTFPFVELINMLHPTPAICGKPTAKAAEIIRDIEGFNRETYSAPIGWVDSKNNGESAIALRCAKIVNNQAELFAGVGIVEGSNPESEWDETQAKFSVMRDAIVNIAQ